MDREQDVAEGKCLFAVDSRWAAEAILRRRHTVVGNEEETGLGWQSPLERAV